MLPNLITIPGLDYTVRTWGFFVVVGFLFALFIGRRMARRTGADPEVIASMAIIGALLGAIGCRGMHVLHHLWGKVQSGEVGVSEAATMGGGGEILGGVLLGAVGVIAYLLIVKKPVRQYLDIMLPPAILAMGIGRLGCLGFGCCWGGVCVTEAGDKGLPWMVQFPYGSPAYVRHWEEGQIEVPQPLMWKPPAGTRDAHLESAPIPREVLNDEKVSIDAELNDYIDKLEAYAVLKKKDPEAAKSSELAKEIQELQPVIRERPAFKSDVTLAVHLRKLASQSPNETPLSLKDLRTMAAEQHSLWVHPTQLYDAVCLTAMFFLLSAIFYRRKRHGVVVAWAMILYPVCRYLQEMIRADNPHDVAGFTISQAISILVVVGGVVMMLLLLKFGKQLPADQTFVSTDKDD